MAPSSGPLQPSECFPAARGQHAGEGRRAETHAYALARDIAARAPRESFDPGAHASVEQKWIASGQDYRS